MKSNPEIALPLLASPHHPTPVHIAHASGIALSFGKRPAEELYDLKNDPAQLRNVAASPDFAHAKRRLSDRLDQWLRDTSDPRVDAATDVFDSYPYLGPKL